MPTSLPAPSRRTALVVSGLTLGLGAVGCGERDGTPASTARRGAEDGDEPLLDQARADLARVAALVAGTRRAHRGLRRPLAGLARAHRDQAAVLDPDGEAAEPGTDPAVATRPADALADVVREEERLARRLVTWAVAADSGPLARALAASAAGVAQHLAVLDRERAEA